jgi:hypothetical protein
MRSPALVLIATRRIHDLVRDRLTAAEWQQISGELDSAMATLNDFGRVAEHDAAVRVIVRQLSRFEASRTLLADRLAAQDALLDTAGSDAEAAALRHILAAADLDTVLAADKERHVVLKPGGLGGATSIKLKNFRFDSAALLTVGSSSVASVASAVDAPRPMVIAASVLAIAQSVLTSATKRIGEDEASLFWSLVQTAGRNGDKTTSEDDLRVASDKDRQEFGLAPLGPAEFIRALRTLEALGSTAPAGAGRWRLIESYRVAV